MSLRFGPGKNFVPVPEDSSELVTVQTPDWGRGRHGTRATWIGHAGFLIETREQVERSYGKDSPFGRVVENVFQTTMRNTDIPLAEIKDKVKETWPKLEAVAKNVDVLKL